MEPENPNTPPAGPDGGSDTPANPGSNPAPETPGNGPSDPNAQNNQSDDFGVIREAFGDKYQKPEEFAKAYKELQAENTRLRAGNNKRFAPQPQPSGDGTQPNDDDRPLTVKAYREMQQVNSVQQAELERFTAVADKYNLTDRQRQALESMGEKNPSDDWEDLALGLWPNIKPKVESKNPPRNEPSDPTPKGPQKPLEEMTPAEIDALSDEEFMRLSNAKSKRKSYV